MSQKPHPHKEAIDQDSLDARGGFRKFWTGLVAALLVAAASAFYAHISNKRLEEYKTESNNKLEEYKTQVQREFQKTQQESSKELVLLNATDALWKEIKANQNRYELDMKRAKAEREVAFQERQVRDFYIPMLAALESADQAWADRHLHDSMNVAKTHQVVAYDRGVILPKYKAVVDIIDRQGNLGALDPGFLRAMIQFKRETESFESRWKNPPPEDPIVVRVGREDHFWGKGPHHPLLTATREHLDRLIPKYRQNVSSQ
jgi:hypothetical protein